LIALAGPRDLAIAGCGIVVVDGCWQPPIRIF